MLGRFRVRRLMAECRLVSLGWLRGLVYDCCVEEKLGSLLIEWLVDVRFVAWRKWEELGYLD